MRDRMLAMLDVVALVNATRAGLAAMDRSSALLMFVLSGAGAFVSGGYTWIADWLPTWRFANGEAPHGYGYTPTNVAQALIDSGEQLAVGAAGLGAMTLASFIGATIAVGVTLFPTILQFVAPRVLHPAARVAADISIWFDFITDWPQAWAQAGGVATFLPVRVVVTCVLVLIYSILLQTIFVLCLTAFAMSVVILLAGERRRAHHAGGVIEM